MKTLVADDDSTLRLLLEGLLPKWGHEVVCAADGDEACMLLGQADAPRLLILDWMMPGIDGVELCRRLRERDQQDPFYVLVLTSRTESQDLVKALQGGADDYVTKPFDADELRARLQVGERVLRLQDKLREHEHLNGVLQTARAVCHELNQPLQVVLGFCEMLAIDLPQTDPKRAMLAALKEGAQRLGRITREVMQLTHAQTQEYLGHPSRIADLVPLATPNHQFLKSAPPEGLGAGPRPKGTLNR